MNTIRPTEPSPLGRGQGEGTKGQFNTSITNGIGIISCFQRDGAVSSLTLTQPPCRGGERGHFVNYFVLGNSQAGQGN
jgi:hypothetical protein